MLVDNNLCQMYLIDAKSWSIIIAVRVCLKLRVYAHIWKNIALFS